MLVVPTSQPERRVIDALLGARPAMHDALTAAFGLRVIPSEKLSAEASRAWQRERLSSVSFGTVETPTTASLPASSSYVSVANTQDSVPLINRLLGVPGMDVRWNLAATGKQHGTFIVHTAASVTTLEQYTSDLVVTVTESDTTTFNGAAPLRMPRIGIYAGQGVNAHQAASLGSVRWLLHRWGFSFVLFDETNVDDKILNSLDVVVVPNGIAAQIMNGWDATYTWYRYPWDTPGEPRGIANEGAAAIRRFVERGGSYIGLDAGGGRLAGPEFLGLLNFEIVASNLGLGAVDLEIVTPSSPIFAGLSGSWDGQGQWRQHVIPALYWSEPRSGVDGGCVFKPGNGTTILASYQRAYPADGLRNLVGAERLLVPGENGAIISGQFGTGTVTLFGIEPSFRCYWESTFRLLSNALFGSVTSG